MMARVGVKHILQTSSSMGNDRLPESVQVKSLKYFIYSSQVRKQLRTQSIHFKFMGVF